MKSLSNLELKVVSAGSKLTDVGNGLAIGEAMYELGDRLCGGYDNCGAILGEAAHEFIYPDPFGPPHIPDYEIWNMNSGWIYY